jgi:ribosomal protein S15
VRRQDELGKERAAALGDPIHGITTPFVESFDTVSPINNAMPARDDSAEAPSTQDTPKVPLNHFLKPDEVTQSLQHSYILTQPLISPNRELQDPAREAEEIEKHRIGHEKATAAITRMLSLQNGNQKDRTRANIQRCIETFGRHNTDEILKERPQSYQPRSLEKTAEAEKTPRAGPDTGSSEVQIAILTAKIRVLAKALEIPGAQKDKTNKRNLRLLVHKRQKLLAYLRKKERGSERWQHVVETLGLTEGTWKGEISL